MNLVATDSRRLAFYSVNGVGVDNRKMVIPPKVMVAVSKEVGEEVSVYPGDKMVGFVVGNAEFTVRLIEEQYPDYVQVIPKDNDKVLRVDKAMFVEALRRVLLVSDSATHGIAMEMGSTREMSITAKSDIGEASEVLPVEYTGDSFRIFFNGSYLMDILRRLDSDVAVLTFKGELTSAVIKCADRGEGEDYFYLLMPTKSLF